MGKIAYPSGKEVKLNDAVTYGGQAGRVVFIIESAEFSPKFKKSEWDYLKKGIGIELEDSTMFHLDEVDEDLRFVRRGGAR